MQSGKLKSTVTPQEQFSRIESPNIQRSTFDRSHGYKTTLDAGKIYPVFVDEALPGDTFNISATMFGRLSTPLKPIMDNIKFDLHFFSVPNRLVWENWERFNGQQDDPDSSTDYLIPTITSPSGGYSEASLYDYMGLPTKIEGIEHNVLPLRAYNLIWNEWYRDQNLQDSITVNKDDGPDSDSLYTVRSRNKRKDYFTSSLPFAQKGEAVSIPLGTSAPITTNYSGSEATKFENSNGTGNGSLQSNAGGSLVWTGSLSSGQTMRLGEPTYLQADLSDATAATINALREAFQVQRMYERDARGGTRYTELIKSHFGVTSPDARLQRPEYLGGGSADVNITPVAQTSGTESGITPQGNLTGVGTFSVNNNGFVKSFTEHEIVIGLVSVRADLNYQQGLHKMWSRQTRFDFYWPSFAHLGEQAILNKEIYAQGTSSDEEVFGYQERYAEYRYKPSQITGQYRSNATTSLDIWHLAQDFSSLPALNSSFIEENPPIDRVIAVPSEPQFLLDCFFNFKASRPMPTYSTPGLIDHF